jgi:hypothetical protein
VHGSSIYGMGQADNVNIISLSVACHLATSLLLCLMVALLPAPGQYTLGSGRIGSSTYSGGLGEGREREREVE